MSKINYQRLESVETVTHSKPSPDLPRKSNMRVALVICIFQTCIIIALASVLWYQSMYYARNKSESWKVGFSTDYWELTGEIGLEQTAFAHTILPNWTAGEWQSVWDEDRTRYGGPPSPELDDNWYALLAGINFNRTEEEAKGLKSHTFQYPDGNYLVGLEVFHALHCINKIRKSLYPNYYTGISMEESEWAEHIGHCIDRLTQYVQCNADLTPMYFESHGSAGLIAVTNTTHTCRNFTSISRWIMDQRPIWYGSANLSCSEQGFQC